MNWLWSVEITNVKARNITLTSALEIELSDGNRREYTCPKTAVNAALSPSFESSVYIAEYSDVMGLISANYWWISKGFASDVLYFVSSKLKIGLEVNHGGFSAITIGDMSSKLILEFAKCDFKR